MKLHEVLNEEELHLYYCLKDQAAYKYITPRLAAKEPSQQKLHEMLLKFQKMGVIYYINEDPLQHRFYYTLNKLTTNELINTITNHHIENIILGKE